MHRTTLLRILIVLTGFVGCETVLAQAPPITSVSGAWYHRSTLTIHGSGFGLKTTAAPTVWDDASGTDIHSKWYGTWPDCAGNAAYNLAYRTPAQVGRGIPLPHNHIIRYISGAHNGSGGANCGSNVMMWVTRPPSDPHYTYGAWYERVDDGWHFGDDDNFKTFSYSVNDSPYVSPYMYIEYNPRPTSTTSSATWHLNYAGLNMQSPDQNGHSMWWDEAINPMSGVWKKIEVEIRHTTANDGYIKLWENGVLKIDYLGPTDNPGGSIRTTAIGGYARNYPYASNWRYFADVYLDYARNRVILGNASTYAASTIREVQIPSSWSDTSITITANLGRFSAGQSAYLYVVDPSGNVVDQSGYGVRMGGLTTHSFPADSDPDTHTLQ